MELLSEGEKEVHRLQERINTAKMLVSQLNISTSMTSQTVAAYSDIISGILLDVAVDMHRAHKLGLGVDHSENYLPRRFGAEETTAGQKGLLDMFGHSHPPSAMDNIECHNCGRKVQAGRYAPHLEKCMGKGRNAGRAAAKNVHMAWSAPQPVIPAQRIPAAPKATVKRSATSKKRTTTASPSGGGTTKQTKAAAAAATAGGGGAKERGGGGGVPPTPKGDAALGADIPGGFGAAFGGSLGGGGGGSNLDAFDFGAALDDGFGIADDDALNLDNMELDLGDMGGMDMGGGGSGPPVGGGGGGGQQLPPAVPKATRTKKRRSAR